jgi:pimeloyl-ACP methyl ester carboxylesterase
MQLSCLRKAKPSDESELFSFCPSNKIMVDNLVGVVLIPVPFLQIQPKVLVINGESDRMVPTSNTVDLDRRLPDSQLVIYPDSGHGGIFQNHDDFVTRVLAFL